MTKLYRIIAANFLGTINFTTKDIKDCKVGEILNVNYFQCFGGYNRLNDFKIILIDEIKNTTKRKRIIY